MLKFNQFINEHALGFMSPREAGNWYKGGVALDIDNNDKFKLTKFDIKLIDINLNVTYDAYFVRYNNRWWKVIWVDDGGYATLHGFMTSDEVVVHSVVLDGSPMAIVHASNNRLTKQVEREAKNYNIKRLAKFSRSYKKEYADLFLDDLVQKVNKLSTEKFGVSVLHVDSNYGLTSIIPHSDIALSNVPKIKELSRFVHKIISQNNTPADQYTGLNLTHKPTFDAMVSTVNKVKRFIENK